MAAGRARGSAAWSSGPFLLSAAPGAGKTRPALEHARGLLRARALHRIVVVCPTTPLTRQWAGASQRDSDCTSRRCCATSDHLVADLRRRDGRSHAEMNRWLNRTCGIQRVDEASIDQLERSVALLLGALTARRR